MITQALIIDEPWITKILDGEKTWEMRSRPTRKVGQIGLIKKGSGTIVGVARIGGSLPPIDKANWMRYFAHHRVPMNLVEQPSFNWFVPWVLTDVKKLARPVRYDHPSGAVQFVNLSLAESVELNVASQNGSVANSKKLTTTKTESIENFEILNNNLSAQTFPRFVIKDFVIIASALTLSISGFIWIGYSIYAIINWSGNFVVFAVLALLIIFSSAALQATIGGEPPKSVS